MPCDRPHSTLQLQNLHGTFRWIVADAAARGALLPDSQAIGADAFQVDTGGLWKLVSIDTDGTGIWTQFDGAGGGGGGGVSGPVSSTDDALARWDGVNGDTLQDSGFTLSDGGVMNGNQIILTGNLSGNQVSGTFVTVSDHILLTEQAAPLTPSIPGFGQLYVISGSPNRLAYRDEDGDVFIASIDRFIDLLDTPAVYTGQQQKILQVNTAENAIEFVDFGVSVGAVQEVVGGVETDGVGGVTIKAGSNGIASVSIESLSLILRVVFDVAFPDTNYFVQLTNQVGVTGHSWLISSKSTTHVDIGAWDILNDVLVTFNSVAASVDISVQDDPAGSVTVGGLGRAIHDPLETFGGNLLFHWDGQSTLVDDSGNYTIAVGGTPAYGPLASQPFSRGFVPGVQHGITALNGQFWGCTGTAANRGTGQAVSAYGVFAPSLPNANTTPYYFGAGDGGGAGAIYWALVGVTGTLQYQHSGALFDTGFPLSELQGVDAYHLGLTRTAGDLVTVYLNGVSIFSSATTPPAVTTGELYIGSIGTAANGYMFGGYQTIKVLDVALTAAQMAQEAARTGVQ